MTSTSRFETYCLLYEEYLNRMIKWSEQGLLEPRYLHLHESDIGIRASPYRHWRYLAAFLTTLGPLRVKLRKVLFCYSFETSSPCLPRDAERLQFYCYEHQLDGGAIDEMAFGWKGKNALERPELLSVKKDLPALLGDASLIQPYILESTADGVRHVSELQRGCQDIACWLANYFHRTEGCYQFSIYGYWLEAGESLPEEEQLLLRQVCLNHLHAWNHDLHGIHFLSEHMSQGLPDIKRSWPAVKKGMAEILERLDGIVSPDSPVGDFALPTSGNIIQRLLANPHDPEEISRAPETALQFLDRVDDAAKYLLVILRQQ